MSADHERKRVAFTGDTSHQFKVVNVVPLNGRFQHQIATVIEVARATGHQQPTWRPSSRASHSCPTVAVESLEAQAVIAAMTTPPSAARQAAITSLVTTLQSGGVWDKLDLLYIPAAADAQAAALNWKSPGNFTASPLNSPTFTADRGWTGNGTTQAIKTGWKPGTNGVNFTLNDCSAWFWNLREIEYALGDIGAKVTSTAQVVFRSKIINVMGGRLNDGNLSPQPANSTAIGFYGIQRTAANARQYFQNGALVPGSASTEASIALNNDEQWFLGANPSGFSPHQQCVAAWGASLAGKEAAFYNALRTYLQAVGAVA